MLYWAVVSGNVDVVEVLLDNGASADNRHFHMYFNPLSNVVNAECAALLLDRGARINSWDHNGWTALRFAVNDGRFDVVRLLVERGADFNRADVVGNTPVAAALQLKRLEIFYYLVRNKFRCHCFVNKSEIVSFLFYFPRSTMVQNFVLRRVRLGYCLQHSLATTSRNFCSTIADSMRTMYSARKTLAASRLSISPRNTTKLTLSNCCWSVVLQSIRWS